MTSVGNPWLWVGFIASRLACSRSTSASSTARTRSIDAEGGAGLDRRLDQPRRCLQRLRLVAVRRGRRRLEFLTGYLIEKSLSVDNLFVFVIIFGTFAIPPQYQHRVLFWGILTALVLRAAMILGGTALLAAVPLAHLRLRRVPHRHRREAVLPQGGGAPPGEELGVPRAPAGHPLDPPHRGARLLHARERAARRDAALPRARAHRGHGRRVRGRLDPRDLRRDARPVHRLHLEHLRDPRPARRSTSRSRASSDRFEYLSVGPRRRCSSSSASKMLGVAWIHVHALVSLAVVVALLGGAMRLLALEDAPRGSRAGRRRRAARDAVSWGAAEPSHRSRTTAPVRRRGGHIVPGTSESTQPRALADRDVVPARHRSSAAAARTRRRRSQAESAVFAKRACPRSSCRSTAKTARERARRRQVVVNDDVVRGQTKAEKNSRQREDELSSRPSLDLVSRGDARAAGSPSASPACRRARPPRPRRRHGSVRPERSRAQRRRSRAGRSSVEHDGLVPVDDDPVLAVPAHGAGERPGARGRGRATSGPRPSAGGMTRPTSCSMIGPASSSAVT